MDIGRQTAEALRTGACVSVLCMTVILPEGRIFLCPKGGMPLCEINEEHVLDELAEIAFATPGEEGGLPVKVADKLRALEMLYKHLGLGDGAKTEGVVIVDSES